MASPNQTLNPYASSLGSEDPIEILEATPAKLHALISSISPPAMIEQPAPGKWSIRHILCHLADTESVFGYRLRQTLAEDHHIIQPYDQDKFSSPYQAFSAQQGVDAFTAFRTWNLALIGAVGADEMAKQVTHPERGAMTFSTIVETMAGHDLHHLKQIQALKAV